MHIYNRNGQYSHSNNKHERGGLSSRRGRQDRQERMVPLPTSNIHINLNSNIQVYAMRNVTDEIDLSTIEISQIN